MKTLDTLQLEGKRVLVRADLNVPLNDQQHITDDTRLRGVLPTLKEILSKNCSIVLMSHLGSPGGKPDLRLSLKPVADYLRKAGFTVEFAPETIGEKTREAAGKLAPGSILLLENLRFEPGEKKNDLTFAKELAALGECYVNDAFGTCHRAHASMVSVPALFSDKAAGRLVQKEIEYYNKAMENPTRPLCVIMGGAKVSSKLQILSKIIPIADSLIIGGAMANTFLAAQGMNVGTSLYEPDLKEKALEILEAMKAKGATLHLPVDVVVAPAFDSQGQSTQCDTSAIPADQMALDIGPKTVELYKEAVNKASTILWNGPMGAFEQPDFSSGTNAMVQAVGAAPGLKIVGGGDTDAAIHQMGNVAEFDHLSTGGGAFLALLEGKVLPGIAAIE